MLAAGADEVAAVLQALPQDVKRRAEAVPIVFEKRPSRLLVADGIEEDTLGLFVGPSSLDNPGASPLAGANHFIPRNYPGCGRWRGAAVPERNPKDVPARAGPFPWVGRSGTRSPTSGLTLYPKVEPLINTDPDLAESRDRYFLNFHVVPGFDPTCHVRTPFRILFCNTPANNNQFSSVSICG